MYFSPFTFCSSILPRATVAPVVVAAVVVVVVTRLLIFDDVPVFPKFTTVSPFFYFAQISVVILPKPEKTDSIFSRYSPSLRNEISNIINRYPCFIKKFRYASLSDPLRNGIHALARAIGRYWVVPHRCF